ncbi:hypothetical protein DXT94_21455 [Rhizobium sp. ICMP 5592]|jgi:hypothetical protein|nr:hypothetical protein [Rhizobium sp. ICMP 5592]
MVSGQFLRVTFTWGLEQFQEKCAAVFRPELRKSKKIEREPIPLRVNKTLGLWAKNGRLWSPGEHYRDIRSRIVPLYAFLMASS